MKLFRKLLITITVLTILTLSGYEVLSQKLQSTDNVQHFKIENQNIANIFTNIAVAGVDGNFQEQWNFKGKIEKLGNYRFEIALSKPVDMVTGKQAKFLVIQLEYVKKETRFGDEVYRYKPISSRGDFGKMVQFVWTNRNLHLASLGYEVVMGLGNFQSIVLIHFQRN